MQQKHHKDLLPRLQRRHSDVRNAGNNKNSAVLLITAVLTLKRN